MRVIHPIAIAFFVLAATSTGASHAAVGTTTTNLALRAAPSSNTELLLTIPAGDKVQVGRCSGGWCKVTWNSYSGYARADGLAVQRSAKRAARSYTVQPEIWPIYPPYPYRAGHYPKLDWYRHMPPYVAIHPSFYRKRHFMIAQERNRYRYMPHIFSGYESEDGGGGGIDPVDIQAVGATLRESFAD